MVYKSTHHAQRTGRGLGVKHNPGLLQNPRFNLFMVNAQQVKRAADVVFSARLEVNLALVFRADLGALAHKVHTVNAAALTFKRHACNSGSV